MQTRDWREATDEPTPLGRLDLAADSSDATWSLFAAGDVKYRDREARDAPVAQPLSSRIRDADLSMVNLEAPVAGAGEPLGKSGPTLNVDRDVPDVLRAAGFDVATLANNHLMDYGAEGLRATTAACENVGLASCGAGESESAAMAPARFEVDGTSVAVFSFCEREFGIADGDEPGTAHLGSPGALERVAASNADVTIVAAHGGVEYVPFPPLHRQTRLREFVDAGADLVVGHHPHVPQGWEVYDDTPIFYSLGNFLFPMPERPKTQWSLAIEVAFDGDEPVAVDLVPTETVDETVDEAGDRVDPGNRLAYLHHVASLTADRDQLRAHWQEVAVAIFHQRYTRWLRTALAGDLVSQVRHPEQHFSPDTAWASDDQESQMLALLNLVRNRSHRSLMETALEVETGKREDHRTESVREHVRELVAETEDRPVYDRQSPARKTLSALIDRVTS
ncbi:CapA family protein [Haloarchaeobius amylolyticus]|uniref:CapA family protein n=1 Tax=Haloarchaeobius amylolyticus TaxID=1198296 RepID=UPI00227013B4|nr:CapA family protein [Haloarchaeobius amylolyticus]